MSHPSLPSRVVCAVCPDVPWNQLAEQLRRRRLPIPLQPEQEDLVSESIMRAFKSPPPDGNWAPWINRIFSNIALDRLRVMTRATRAHAHLAYSLPITSIPSPEDNALAHEQNHDLHAAMQSLPPAWQHALEVRFFPTTEIETQAPRAPTVRVHVHRGMARLRSILCSLRVLVLPVYAPIATGTVGIVMLTQVSLATQSPPLLIASGIEPMSLRWPAMAQASSRPRVLVAAKPIPVLSESTNSHDETAPPTRVFDFDDDEVQGNLSAADMTLVQVPLTSKHDSLLEIPATMIVPLLKSLEDI